MKKRLHVLVHGRVQGVFYREFTRKNAEGLGLNGFVRNLSDGSVEAVLEGEELALHKMLRALEIGSKASVVEKVVPKWLSYKDEFSTFVIW